MTFVHPNFGQVADDRIIIFDTTLRDGEQSPGISLNAQEKLEIARQLERLGVDIIEAGFAVSSPGEVEGIGLVAKHVRGCTIASLASGAEATFTLTLAVAPATTGTLANTATVTITETDIGLSFASATYSVDEGATNVVLTVIQTGDTNSVATVDFATADLGATAGSD